MQMAYASKIIGREVGRAALVGKLGLMGEKNATGDSQKKLDVFGSETVLEAFSSTGLVYAMVSEEIEDLTTLPGGENSQYIVCCDPVDGSSNTDINGALGTIFGFWRRIPGASLAENALRKGSDQILAGYVMYSTSTLLVFATDHGVQLRIYAGSRAGRVPLIARKHSVPETRSLLQREPRTFA